MTNIIRLPLETAYPGSPGAIRLGCTCDPVKNDHGRGEVFNDGGNRRVTVALGCPLHSAWRNMSDT